jgi:hypothetical protein
MNDSRGGEKGQGNKHDALVMELITEVNCTLERIRLDNADLGALDPASWRRLQNAAHNIGARAAGLDLQVLQLCALELEQFAVDVLMPSGLDKSESVQGAMVALEALDLELHALKEIRGYGHPF